MKESSPVDGPAPSRSGRATTGSPAEDGGKIQQRKNTLTQIPSQEVMMQNAFELYKKYTTNPDDVSCFILKQS